MNMNLKKVVKVSISVFVISGAIYLAGVSAIPIYTNTDIVSNNGVHDDIITPYDMDVSSGFYRGTQFQATHSLRRANGKNINFWVKNNGKHNVRITINGSHGKTIYPGEQEYITASAGFFSRNYVFKAVATPSGTVDIQYRIAQRD